MRGIQARDIDDAVIWSSSHQRNWLLFGLLMSLALHGLLCFYLYRTQFQPVDTLPHKVPQTTTFNVKKVDLATLLDKPSIDQAAPATKPNPDQTDLQLPEERKSFDKLLEEVHASAAMPDDTSDVLPDKPNIEQSNMTSVLDDIDRATAQTLSKSPNASREQTLLTDTAVSGRPQPALTGTELATSTTIKRPNSFTSQLPADSAGPKRGAPGFSDLDQLLTQKGPLGSGTAIRLPSDPLYEYDSAELQPGAMAELQKLGTLIKRNPKMKFVIEGYSDSFGSPEYNMDLSQQRADSVAQYLVQMLGVNQTQIQTRGFGGAKYLVPPRPINMASEFEVNSEIARQRPNRRVVVVVQDR